MRARKKAAPPLRRKTTEKAPPAAKTAGTTTPELQHLPLRARKKLLTRQAIQACAERLFEARGYDYVSVAEIADAADISVKTLFTYIRSKEDLLFQDDSLMEAVVTALRRRGESVSPARAVAQALILLAGRSETPAKALALFHRGYGESTMLRARLARLWADCEDRIAVELAGERGLSRPDAYLRLEAALLVLLIRSTSWSEVYRLVKQAGRDGTAAFEAWLAAATLRIEGGRPRP